MASLQLPEWVRFIVTPLLDAFDIYAASTATQVDNHAAALLRYIFDSGSTTLFDWFATEVGEKGKATVYTSISEVPSPARLELQQAGFSTSAILIFVQTILPMIRALIARMHPAATK